MNEKELMERMKRANSKVKDGLSTSIIDMLPEDREYASVKLLDKKNLCKERKKGHTSQ